MRIIEVNPEAVDLTEANILDDYSGQNLCGRGQHTQNPYQGQYQSNNYQGNNYQGNHGPYKTHIEVVNRVTIVANLEAEAVVKAEVITMEVVMTGLIIVAIATINTISIIVMMMITSLINMADHVHYVVAVIIPPNIVLRESMILVI